MTEVQTLDALSYHEWDEYVRRSPKSQLLHTTRWKALMEEVYDFEPFHIAATRQQKIVGILPAFLVKSLWGQKIVSAPFGFYCDPLYDDLEALSALLHASQKWSAEGKKRIVQLRVWEPLDPSVEATKGFKLSQPFVVSTLALDSTYEAVEKKFKRRFREALGTKKKRAKELGLIIRNGEGIRDLGNFYTLLVRMYKNRFWSLCQPYRFYERLWDRFHATGEVRLMVAELQGRMIAATLWFFWNKQAYFAWSANAGDRTELQPDSLLFERFIREACSLGYGQVNFGISSPKMESLIFFKERWGAETHPINYYECGAKKNLAHHHDIYTSRKGLRLWLRFVPTGIVKIANHHLARYFA